MTSLNYKIVTMMNHFYLASAIELAEAAFVVNGSANKTLVRHHPQVVGAVLCSCSFLEVVISDFFQDARESSRRSKYRDALRDVWNVGFDRQPLLPRFQVALALGNLPRFDVGSEPYQSTKALIDLRNALSHPKKVFGISGESVLEKCLKGKYKFEPIDAYHSFFPDACLSPQCATWAARSVASFAEAFYSRLPKSMSKYRMNLKPYIKQTIKLDSNE